MKAANLFQLGMDLEAGTTHAEETGKPRLKVVDDSIVEAGQARSSDGVVDTLCDSEREDHFIRRGGRIFAGTHLLVEVVDATGLDDEGRIQQAMRDCVDACGATLLHIHTHKFTPQGVSGVAVLAESHISVHTWPEIGYGAFDVFMCGDAQPWQAVEVLRRAFDAGDVIVKEFLRGEEVVAARL